MEKIENHALHGETYSYIETIPIVELVLPVEKMGITKHFLKCIFFQRLFLPKERFKRSEKLHHCAGSILRPYNQVAVQFQYRYHGNCTQWAVLLTVETEYQ